VSPTKATASHTSTGDRVVDGWAAPTPDDDVEAGDGALVATLTRVHAVMLLRMRVRSFSLSKMHDGILSATPLIVAVQLVAEHGHEKDVPPNEANREHADVCATFFHIALISSRWSGVQNWHCV
jgi:hypothetical protein